MTAKYFCDCCGSESDDNATNGTQVEVYGDGHQIATVTLNVDVPIKGEHACLYCILNAIGDLDRRPKAVEAVGSVLKSDFAAQLNSLRGYISKASFSTNADKQWVLTCLDNLAKELA